MNDFKEFIDRIDPLDLLFIQNHSPFSKITKSKDIVKTKNRQFSHCAIVLDKAMIGNVWTDSSLYVLEMNVSLTYPFEMKEFQMEEKYMVSTNIDKLSVFLKRYVIDYGSTIALFKLKDNPIRDKELGRKQNRIINQIIREKILLYFHYRTPLEMINMELLYSIFPSSRTERPVDDRLFIFLKKNHPWIFSSEIIYEIYRDLRILDTEIPLELQEIPKNFDDKVDIDQKIYSIIEFPPVYLKNKSKKYNWFNFLVL